MKIHLAFLSFALLSGSQTLMYDLPSNSGINICNNYHSALNCIGGNYIPGMIHQGLDFKLPVGATAISATHGVITRIRTLSCSGYGIYIKTDIKDKPEPEAPSEYLEARYYHVKPDSSLKEGNRIKPGDVLGTVIPLLGTTCYGSTPHVHYELKLPGKGHNAVNPHKFWMDGPGKVTCYKKNKEVPAGKAIAPVLCKES